MKRFYRVANNKTQQGLWYDFQGNFTGLIHNEFTFCTNTKLPMPFDKRLVGWLSATETLDELFAWFTKKDIELLESFGFEIALYEASEYKQHENHWIINQETSRLVELVELKAVS